MWFQVKIWVAFIIVRFLGLVWKSPLGLGGAWSFPRLGERVMLRQRSSSGSEGATLSLPLRPPPHILQDGFSEGLQ